MTMVRQIVVIVIVCSTACMTGVGDVPQTPPDEEPPPQQPSTPTVGSIAGGSFRSIAPYTTLTGQALMVRRLDGTTELSIAISGLGANATYTAHLHAAACEFAGGGHYKIDPLVADVIESNELWLRGTTSITGGLIATGAFQHLTRGEALSVVVHDPMGGAKMACADLLGDDVEAIELGGNIAPFAAATAGDQTITGTIVATRTGAGTSLMLNLGGLDPAAVGYGTHVHAEPCEVATGGGHYKLDPRVVDTVETNEIWLPVTGYATAGATSSTVTTAHGVRADAQSIVVHRTITDLNKPKVACANLSRKTAFSPLATTGSAIAFVAEGTFTGTAIMTRKLTGVTDVALVMTGLVPAGKYAAHVHDLPCAIDKGGGHYKRDRSITDARADNELWFELAATADGTASDSTWAPHIATADAQSLVVHDEAGARLACFDLR